MLLLLWLLWATIAIPDLEATSEISALIANDVNICQVTHTVTETISGKCSSGLTFYKEGYAVDKVASNLDQYTDEKVDELINYWFNNPLLSPDCQFFRMVDKTVPQCCEGWTGASCETPVCIPSCSENGVCANPNYCKCNTGYVGPTCADFTAIVKQYCYTEASCAGEKAGVADVVSREDCCIIYSGKGWGLSGSDDCIACSHVYTEVDISNFNPETPTVILNMGNLPFRTCVGYGPNYYRTFDGLEFSFPGRCTYLLFSDGIRTVELENINCHLYTQCRKKLTFKLNGRDEVVVQGSSIWDGGVEITVNDSTGYASLTSSVHIEKKGEYYYLEYGTLRARWDTDGSWFLTLQEPLSSVGSSTYKGLCGNFDGDALDDLNDIHGDTQTPVQFGNSWAVINDETACNPAQAKKKKVPTATLR